MAEEKVPIVLEVDASGATRAVGTMRKQIKEATIALQEAQAQFGEYSAEAIAAAKRVADLKDRVQDVAETAALFDPGQKFAAFSGALNAVAGGFSAVQGALGLVGVESEEVQKQLLKVQSALALSQGLSTITDSAKDFQRLGAVIKQTETFQKGLAAANLVTSAAMKAVGVSAVTTSTGFKVLRGAIISTGIGALAIGLVLLIQNFGKVKDAVINLIPGLGAVADFIGGLITKVTDFIGITSEAERQTAAMLEDNAKRIKAAERNLELNGDKYDEYTQRKIKANIDYRKSLEELTKDETLSLAERNQYIADARAKADREIARADADRTKAADDARKAEQKKIDDKNKQAADKRKAANEKIAQDEKSLNAELLKLKQDAIIAELKTEEQRQIKAVEFAAKNEEDRINATKASEKTKAALIKEVRMKADRDIREINQKTFDAEEKAIKANAQKVREVNDEIRLANIEDEGIRAVEAVRLKYEKQYAEIDAQERESKIKQTELRKALQEREQQEIDAIELDRKRKAAKEREADILKQIQDEQMPFNARRAAIDSAIADLVRLRDAGIITDKEYTESRKQLSDARKKIDSEEKASFQEIRDAYAQTLGQVANLLGKNTAAGKAAAIAEATINTYSAAVKAFNANASIPPSPLFGVLAGGVAVAAGLKNVREIMKVPVPGGSGGGSMPTPSISAPTFTAPSSTAPIAPPRPQVSITQLDRTSMQGINVASTRAYVVESDITGAQERITRINRAARLG